MGRLRSMTERVFDELLEHTPVGALGFNFNYDRITEIADVGGYLASCVAGAQVGLEKDSLMAGELSLRRLVQGRSVLVAIRSLGEPGCESVVQVANNFDYRLAKTEPGFFKLRDTFSEWFLADLEESERQTSSVVEVINRSRGRR